MKKRSKLISSLLLAATILCVGSANVSAGTIAPSGSFSPTTSGWSNDEITTIFSPTDSGGSGVDYWDYRISTDGGLTYGTWSVSKVFGETNLPFTFRDVGSHRVQARVYDKNGNTSTITSGVFPIERTLPSGLFTPNSITWTNSNVSVSFNPSDTGGSAVSRWRYSISVDGGATFGAWSTYIYGDTTSSITLSSQGENMLRVEVLDNAGNLKTLSSGVYQIDKSTPGGTFSPNSYGLTNKVVTTFSPSDAGGSTVNYWTYRISTNNGATYGSTVTIPDGNPRDITLSSNGTNRVQAIVYDAAGNQTTVTSGSYNIDSVLPTAPSITTYKNTVAQFSFALTAGTDTGSSGVHRVEYRLSGSNKSIWRTYVSKVTLYEEGLTTIEARTVDNAGNYSPITTRQVKIDTLMTGEEILVYPRDTDGWSDENVPLTVLYAGQSPRDSIVSAQYTFSSSSFFPSSVPNTLPSDGKLLISEEGITFLHVRYEFDNGRVARSTAGPFRKDSTTIPPVTMNLVDSANASVSSWTNEELTLQMPMPSYAGASELKRQYKINGYHSEWKDYEDGTKITVEGNHRVIGRVINGTGNSSLVEYRDAKIDKTPPNYNEIRLTETNDSSGAVYYEVNAITSEDLSGVSSLVTSTGETLKNTSEEHRFSTSFLTTKPLALVIQDNAGNVTNVTFEDVPSVSYKDGYTLGQSVSKNDIIATINGTGIIGVKNEGAKTDCLSKPCDIVLDKNGEFIFYNINGKLNSERKVSIENLDKTATKVELDGERNPADETEITLNWNRSFTGGELLCSWPDGNTRTTLGSATTITFADPTNSTHQCQIKGDLNGQYVSSNSVTIYPNYEKEASVQPAPSIPEILLPNNVWVDETRYGTTYFINLNKENSNEKAIRVPTGLFQ